MLLSDLDIEQYGEVEEDLASHWQAGVEYILSDQPEDAHAALLMPFLMVNSVEDEENLQSSLVQYLTASAEEQEVAGAIDNACAILCLLQDIFPNILSNRLRLVSTSLRSDNFNFDLLSPLLAVLQETEEQLIDQALLSNVVRDLLRFCNKSSMLLMPDNFVGAMVRAFLEKTNDWEQAIVLLCHESFVLSQQQNLKSLRLEILEICLDFCGDSLRFDLLCQAAAAAAFAGAHQKSVQFADLCYAINQEQQADRLVIASHQLLASLMEAGQWQRIPAAAQEHQAKIQAFLDSGCQELPNPGPIIASSYFLTYVYDQPRLLHSMRNDLGHICAATAQKRLRDTLPDWQATKLRKVNKKVLNIGYIGSTLNRHSVGWLSRWLFKYHNHDDFQVFIYNVMTTREDVFHQQYFQPYANTCHYFGMEIPRIVQQIQQDGIDILIDLDSLTYTITYEVMCCRPAPIQITWLGWDASGCPEIDYFIADHHVLPADADTYFQSKIWRLPHTYIAVDGFEVSVPTKRREDYGIPSDAVVYICTQRSYKHSPDILRLQMQIIRAVPNSYLLVKVRGDRDSLMNNYQVLADEVGIGMDQLRFLDLDYDEYTYRANLHLADVVLDTFPYNGATTTLETIWSGVPIVTKVGESFVARNSYAFLTNAGITEGIAYTDEEYVNWGVELGNDPTLRQQVIGKMLQSRKTSPLWNSQQFTLEMENAYRQIWEIHQEKLSQSE